MSPKGTPASEGGDGKTEVAFDIEDATPAILKFYANTKGKMDVCVDQNWFSIVNDVELYRKEFRQMKVRGVEFRIISDITKANISDCKKVIEWAEVRHIGNIRGNFGLNETEFIVATSSLQQGKPVTQVICTGVPGIVEHQQYMFDILWNRAVPAEQMVAEIEQGIKPEVVEIIQNRERAELLLLSGIENAKSEVLAAVSSLSFLSRLAGAGLVEKMERAKLNGAHIMMICPNMPDKADDNDQIQALVAEIRKHAEVQDISGTIKGSVFVFDDREILTIGDDEKGTRGLALLSSSKSLIINYGSLFEYFWSEREALHSVMRAKRELLESNALLLAANERLTENDRLQKEFINIAAHELRTPIQPILGVLDMYDVSAKAVAVAAEEDEEDDEEELRVKKYHMRMIARNAARLSRLSSDILDATRIENNSLKLNVDRGMHLVELASDVVEDARKSVGDRIKFVVKSPDGAVLVDGDWSRLTQVLDNLLSNAVKFIASRGVISVTVEKVSGNHQARITVADTGSGINEEVLPRLFQKFASKTDTGSGTGLGLFISKAIVEAHGGRIWARNNADRKGATFYFTLPLNDSSSR